MLTQFGATVQDDPDLQNEPRILTGFIFFGCVWWLDTACHQQMRANEIRACLIRGLKVPYPLVISWMNDQGPLTPGWVWKGGQGGCNLLAHYPWASVNIWSFDLLSSWLHGEGGCVCAEASVKQENNPFVSFISLATPVMKNKKMNKQNIFLSLQDGNPSPTCLIYHLFVPRGMLSFSREDKCLKRWPLPVTPGCLQHCSHMGGCNPWRT